MRNSAENNLTEITDAAIVDLYFERDEQALILTRAKYEKLYMNVALSVLNNNEDAEECFNDMLFKIWNAIPPERPISLKAYGSRIIRNLAFDRYDKRNAEKRGCDQLFEELSECLETSVEDELPGEKELGATIDAFLRSLDRDDRILFIKRYFMGQSLKELSEHFAKPLNTVKTKLARIRKNLKRYLEKEGVSL